MLQTIPSTAQMANLVRSTPEYMVPNERPYAVVVPEYLDDAQCDRILALGEITPPHSFHGCNAETREFRRPLDACLEPILATMLLANDCFFDFDVETDSAAAYMQTYRTGNNYQWHVDGAPGQSRKLTAVAMLTNERDYEGGSLTIQVSQKHIAAPSGRGTVIVFPAWVNHQVTTIEQGRRQTVNMGLWGRPFK